MMIIIIINSTESFKFHTQHSNNREVKRSSDMFLNITT